jgi:GNAT superfamily N-acetyltransferase
MIESGSLMAVVGEHRDYLFHTTKFSALRLEGSALFAMHWLEASADHSVPLAVDWGLFLTMEEYGAELCVAVRAPFGVLVGYAVYIIHHHLHYAGLKVAEADAFFLRHEDRHGWLGAKLFQFAEQELRKMGVHEVYQRVKKHVRPGRGRSDLGPLFKYLGYREVETIWRKRID